MFLPRIWSAVFFSALIFTSQTWGSEAKENEDVRFNETPLGKQNFEKNDDLAYQMRLTLHYQLELISSTSRKEQSEAEEYQKKSDLLQASTAKDNKILNACKTLVQKTLAHALLAEQRFTNAFSKDL